MKTRKEKREIKIGDTIYGMPSDGSIKNPCIGTVIGYSEAVKKYAIEWAGGQDSRESYEKEMFVRAGLFSMQCISEAMGLNLPQQEDT